MSESLSLQGFYCRPCPTHPSHALFQSQFDQVVEHVHRQAAECGHIWRCCLGELGTVLHCPAAELSVVMFQEETTWVMLAVFMASMTLLAMCCISSLLFWAWW